MRPHFIFNALNNIAAMIPIDATCATQMLTRFSDLYRLLLEASQKTTSLLSTEIQIVESYLELQSMRHGERLRYSISVPRGETLYLPSLVLQTLVENAVKHGIAKAREGGEIELTIERADALYRATVRNSGARLANPSGEGTGLANTRKRLDLLYGARHRFRIFADARGQTFAQFHFTGEGA